MDAYPGANCGWKSCSPNHHYHQQHPGPSPVFDRLQLFCCVVLPLLPSTLAIDSLLSLLFACVIQKTETVYGISFTLVCQPCFGLIAGLVFTLKSSTALISFCGLASHDFSLTKDHDSLLYIRRPLTYPSSSHTFRSLHISSINTLNTRIPSTPRRVSWVETMSSADAYQSQGQTTP